MYIPEKDTILNEVIAAYDFPETLLGAVRYGSGHINDTFCLVCQPKEGNAIRFILQGLSVADIQDLFAVYDNGAVFKERILRVPCDHPSVPDYKHNPASLYDNFTVSLFHSFSLKNELVCHKISEEEKISEN